MGSHKRTPLTLAEITPGVVAFFDAALLRALPSIAKPYSVVKISHPFVCFEVEDARSAWLALTRQPRPERVRIEPEWVANAYGSFLGALYVSCGDDVYRGPSEDFVLAAAGEYPFNRARGRPRVLTPGLDAIRAGLALPRASHGREGLAAEGRA